MVTTIVAVAVVAVVAVVVVGAEKNSVAEFVVVVEFATPKPRRLRVF